MALFPRSTEGRQELVLKFAKEKVVASESVTQSLFRFQWPEKCVSSQSKGFLPLFLGGDRDKPPEAGRSSRDEGQREVCGRVSPVQACDPR